MFMTPDFEKIYKNIDSNELTTRIREFRKLNIRNMSTSELGEAVYKVLLVNNSFIFPTRGLNYPARTLFFRVRKLDGSIIPNKNLSTLSDFWNPPSEVILNYGRLNKPNESLLYTSPDFNVSIQEMKIKNGEYFALIKYESKEVIKTNSITSDIDFRALNINDPKAQLNLNIINDFLKDEFSRDVGIGTEYLYKTSEFISKVFFDLPPRSMQDAWLYSSMWDKTNYNVCFRPEIAKELLELKGAVIAKLDDNLNTNCYAIGYVSKINNNVLFEAIGSDMQKELFPEICPTKN